MLPKRSADFSAWYNTLLKKAGLIEDSPVRGCPILKPYGFSLWEKIKTIVDQALKKSGHQNAYFPLFIPKSYLSREASHIEGFARECAVVTHYRLKNDPSGQLIPDPASELEEPLIIRPTSETIIWDTYRKWITSYRDLPLLINQWANVVRWEMRTRPFLRTTEILWQEGHTAHATAKEANEEALSIIDLYEDFITNYLAIHVIKGEKTVHERFAGACTTYTLEALMQDGKALQLATSHFLGQNFSKTFDVKYTDAKGKINYVWGSSWGLTTRLIGALVMTHSDDKGLVLPPKIAPIQVVILPITRSETLLAYARSLQEKLNTAHITTHIDNSDSRPGWKLTEYELKGIPLCIVVGPRDLKNATVEIKRRDTRQKQTISIEVIIPIAETLLADMQKALLTSATARTTHRTTSAKRYDELREALSPAAPNLGFVLAEWDGTTDTEEKVKQETQATIRCIVGKSQPGASCVYSGNPASQKVLFAKAY